MRLRTKLLLPILLAYLVFILSLQFYWRPALIELEREEVVDREQDVLRNIMPLITHDLLSNDLEGIVATLDRMRDVNLNENYMIEHL